jgi:hypothetical protein
MTATALLHNLQFEPGLIGSSDGMCRVTVIADWQWFVGLAYKRGVNASLELFLYAMMAATASLRDIFPVHTRQ